jgi:hypothetical protein
MEQHARVTTSHGQFADRLDCPNLVVDPHHADECYAEGKHAVQRLTLDLS